MNSKIEIKILFLFIFTFLMIIGLSGQPTFSKQTLSNAGEKSSFTGGSFTWTLGEISVGTISGSDFAFLQGYAPITFIIVTPPTAPGALEASDTLQTSFTANWTSSVDETGYRIDVSTENTFDTFVSGFHDKDVGNVTSWLVDGLIANTQYFYRVIAYNSGGGSPYSNIISVITLPVPPARPDALPADPVGQTDFTARWTSSSTAIGYILDVATDINFTSFVTGYNNLDVSNVTAKTVTGLTANTIYYYRVLAYNDGGNSDYSDTISVTTLLNPPLPPAAPDAYNATDTTQTSFNANWGSSATATSYNLDVATDDSFTSFVTGFNDHDVGLSISYNVSGLDANTPYYYRVRARNSGGTSLSSDTISVVTLQYPPDTPDALYATDTLQTSFTANWNSVPNVSGYNLDVATDLSFASFVSGYNDMDVGIVTNYSVAGLDADTYYYYRVRARNSGGVSLSSDTISVLTLPYPPDPPDAYNATDTTQTSFNANWSSASTATGYNLDVAADNSFTSFVTGFNDHDVGLSTSYNVSGLDANTPYYYRVRARNSGGTSLSSDTISVVTLQYPPDTPDAVNATDMLQTSFTANWNSSATATGYNLDIATDNSFTSFIAGYNNLDVNDVTSHPVEGLTSNTEYFYRVRARNSGGVSLSSDTISVVTLPYPPDPPYAINATDTLQTSYTANWNSSPSATGYNLDVATDISFASFVSGYNDMDVGIVTNYSVTGLDADTYYYYRVRARNSGGISLSSDTISVITLPYSPDPPDAINATDTLQTSFTANWSSVSTAIGYNLDVATDNSFTSFVTGFNDLDVGFVTSYNVAGINANTYYYYRVRARNSGGVSLSSDTISVVTLPYPPDPPDAGIATDTLQTSFTANWNSSATATGYNLDVATDNLFTSLVTGFIDLDVGFVTSYNVSGLNANTFYYFRVRACNSGGVSLSSDTISVMTLQFIPDAPEAINATSMLQTSFIANWKTSTTATGYRLDVSTDNSFLSYVTGYNNLDVGDVISYFIEDLTSKTNYFYRVRAYNSAGTSTNSEIISVTTLPDPPPAPTGLTATSCNNKVTLTWNIISGSDFLRYIIYGGTDSNPVIKIDSTADMNNTGSKEIYGLVTGQTYFFRITAVLSPGVEGTYSDEVSVKVKTGYVPEIVLKWGAVLVCSNFEDSISIYQWYYDSSPIDDTSATKQYYYTRKEPGSYKVEITDIEGCKNFSDSITISSSKALKVYPNPAGKSIYVSLNDEPLGKSVFSIINEAGIKIIEFSTEKEYPELHNEIDITGLDEGIYVLRVVVDQTNEYHTKIIVIK